MDDVFALGMVGSVIGSRCLSSTYSATQVQVDVTMTFEVGTDERGIIVRTVVDDDNLVVAICLFSQRFHEFVYVLAFVLSGHQDGDERIVFEKTETGIETFLFLFLVGK